MRRILAILAMAAGFAPSAPQAVHATPHTITGYYSTGPIRALNSDKCLELVSPHPDQKVDWAPCAVPIYSNPLQIWHAQVIHGSMVIYLIPGINKASVLHICIDGGLHAGEYVYSYDCTEHVNPTSGLILWGYTQDGAQNSIQSVLTGRWIGFHGGVGPATWDAGRNFFLRQLLGTYKSQRVVFAGGWVEVTAHK